MAKFGWGTFFGSIGSQFQSPEQRRRNAIDKLEKRQKVIEDGKRNDLVNEYISNANKLKQLYAEAKNA